MKKELEYYYQKLSEKRNRVKNMYSCHLNCVEFAIMDVLFVTKELVIENRAD